MGPGVRFFAEQVRKGYALNDFFKITGEHFPKGSHRALLKVDALIGFARKRSQKPPAGINSLATGFQGIKDILQRHRFGGLLEEKPTRTPRTAFTSPAFLKGA